MMRVVSSLGIAKKLPTFMLDKRANPFLLNQRNCNVVDEIIHNSRLSVDEKIDLLDRIFDKCAKEIRESELSRLLFGLLGKNVFAMRDLKDPLLETKLVCRHFAKKFNLSDLKDENGDTLLQYCILSLSLNERQILELARHLLRIGINPNTPNKEGMTVLHIVCLKENMSFETRKKLLEIFVQHSADTSVTTQNGKGLIRLMMTAHLYEELTEHQLKDCLAVLFGTDIFTEYRMRELLVNSFAIDPHESVIEKESISFVGSNATGRVSESLAAYSDHFYKKLSSTIGVLQNAFSWRRILSQCKEETKERLINLSNQEIFELQKVFTKIPDLQKMSITSQKLDPEDIFKALTDSQMTMPFYVCHISSDTDAHAIGYFSHNDEIYVCNKGS